MNMTISLIGHTTFRALCVKYVVTKNKPGPDVPDRMDRRLLHPEPGMKVSARHAELPSAEGQRMAEELKGTPGKLITP